MGGNIIGVVFLKLQSELIRSTTEALAEILMAYARKYPLETRNCLALLPNGNCAMMSEILSQVHKARLFKQLVNKFNMQIRKGAQI
ncbi:hypothetical protein AB6A40_004070 [Gnathostoma spinigerum]|uniref:Uncharacterized protein n=1 Tax=Gnathostoma spinigerum TaxID=75299 RepID=A0ABD6ECH5_9BILA